MIRRRLVSVPVLALSWTVACLTLPATLLLVAAVDLVTDRRWPRTRALAAVVWTLSCEVAGVIAATLLALERLLRRDPEGYLERNAILQRLWSRALFAGARWIFSLELVVEGEACAAAAPQVVVVRHVSTVDTLLAAILVANPHRRILRYVLKRELLWDPCLDIVGSRMPNVFLSRSPQHRAADLRAIAGLAEAMPADQGILIFPEGTRFSAAKRERSLAKLVTVEPELHAIATGFRHVLPPRSGGLLAILERGDLDVVFIAHSGLEGAASIASFWRGALIGRTLRVKMWRVAAREVPATARGRVEWLYRQWAEVDDWVESEREN